MEQCCKKKRNASFPTILGCRGIFHNWPEGIVGDAAASYAGVFLPEALDHRLRGDDDLPAFPKKKKARYTRAFQNGSELYFLTNSDNRR
jgi:hypothetical protein